MPIEPGSVNRRDHRSVQLTPDQSELADLVRRSDIDPSDPNALDEVRDTYDNVSNDDARKVVQYLKPRR